MKKRLTKARFDAVISLLGARVGPQTVEIARGVLVDGRPQADFVKSLDLSRSAVSQAVTRVWDAANEEPLPLGFEKITAVLPDHQAYIVKQWAEKAKNGNGQDQK